MLVILYWNISLAVPRAVVRAALMHSQPDALALPERVQLSASVTAVAHARGACSRHAHEYQLFRAHLMVSTSSLDLGDRGISVDNTHYKQATDTRHGGQTEAHREG